MIIRRGVLLLLSMAFLNAPGTVMAAPFNTLADRVYAAAKPALLQVRTIVTVAGRQASEGSAFLVGTEGLAITNYHVVSQYALDPSSYRLEYIMADGNHGTLKLVAIDMANDLAVVRLDHPEKAQLQFSAPSIEGRMQKGERLYSMGNPLELGFTIIEGTYNGLVDKSYNERIHFSGALNPGMSGGPAVTADGRVAGINVAKEFGGELVSFLVPARFAVQLLAHVKDQSLESPEATRAEISKQLSARQAQLYHVLDEIGFRSNAFGPYTAPLPSAPWFACWADTNAEQSPKPRVSVNTTQCDSNTGIFISEHIEKGYINISQVHLKSIDLNAFQFATFMSGRYRAMFMGGNNRWYTASRCTGDFITVPSHPGLRVTWCANAYREFDGLYDVSITAITQDQPKEALITRMRLQAIPYDTALAVARRFIEGIQWAK